MRKQHLEDAQRVGGRIGKITLEPRRALRRPLLRGPRRVPHSLAHGHRDRAVQELAREAPNLGAVPEERDVVAALRVLEAEHAELAPIDAVVGADLRKLRDVRARHRQHETLLRLADPHLGRGEPVVLRRGAVEVHGRADLARHLADGAREAARAAVGETAVEGPLRAVAHREDRVEHLLLCDGVPDLHRVAELVGVLVGELSARECRAVDTVAARTAADRDDEVALLRRALHAAARHQADAAAVDERVADIVVVEVDGAVERGDAHAVAVVAHARDDLREDAVRIEAPLRHLCDVGVRDAEDIGRRDRLGAEARADDVADAAADPRRSAAVGLDRARAVVRLALEAHGVGVVERDDARVVDEHREAPVDAVLHEFMCARCDGRLQEVLHRDDAVGVDLVVRPRLRVGCERPLAL